MSWAIARTAVIYLAATALLLTVAMVTIRRDRVAGN